MNINAIRHLMSLAVSFVHIAPNKYPNLSSTCLVIPGKHWFLIYFQILYFCQSGYVCSVCNFKHDYKRWLRVFLKSLMPNILDLQVHCILHSNESIDYQWPPKFVKERESADPQMVIGQQKKCSAASSSVSRKSFNDMV